MKDKFRMVIIILLLSCTGCVSKQEQIRSLNGKNVRQVISINRNWQFLFDSTEQVEDIRKDRNWIEVDLPHTWNSMDPFDDVDGYYRGVCWYRKSMKIEKEWSNKKVFLQFEGANQVATLYINGDSVGNHQGGYTAFNFDISRYLDFTRPENLVEVKIDNSHNVNLPPLSVGYALYGGIYRDVYLIITDLIHIELCDYASDGFYISTTELNRDNATVQIDGTIFNDELPKTIIIEASIRDSSGNEIICKKSRVDSETGRNKFHFQFDSIKNPHLWSPEDPYLYTLELLIHSDGMVRDRMSNEFGLRYFSFHPENGFSLNGEPYRIRGTNRHQDHQAFGSALSNEMHEADLKNIKEMGCNFVRLAHYPQDPAVLTAADKIGLLVWEEIPLVNYITVKDEFQDNCIRMMKEMIRQHYNHPSVIIWGSMNEILLWSEQGERVRKHNDIQYLERVKNLAEKLEETIRSEDPFRYSAMAIHNSPDYFEHSIARTPMMIGINLYHGWYSGTFNGFSNQLLRLHENNPEMIFFVSEYGAGSDQRLESSDPVRFDFTGRYQLMYHEAHLRQIRSLDFLGGTAIWNQFDFSQPQIGGSIPHLNQKGMASWDRKEKDVYYLYQVNWDAGPVTYIASRDWTKRIGLSDDDGRLLLNQEIIVYSNAGPLEIFHDNISLGTQYPDDICKTSWIIPFHDGINYIFAVSAGYPLTNDSLNIFCKILPANFRNATDSMFPLKINVGSRAQYLDSDGNLWLPDKPYTKGNYGFINGTCKFVDRHMVITGTDEEPIYYSYLEDLSSYRIDLPEGEYQVELHFLEPECMPDNARQFLVSVQGIESIDISLSRGKLSSRARKISFRVTVTGKNSMDILFEGKKGKPVLNGISIQAADLSI